MRALVVLLLVAGCQLASERAALDDGAPDDGAELTECLTAEDCSLAASSCCGCADYAVPATDADDGCDLVECPPAPPEGCTALAPACVDGVCTVACAPVACELTCPAGFATDEAGCLVCGCAPGSDAPACAADADCVRVPADCCGCARGGADTAVAAADAEAFGESLMCPPDPACPDVDVCDADLVARCVAGQCVLDGGALDQQACGTPELPPCPDGTVCVLNAETDSSTDALGVCQPV